MEVGRSAGPTGTMSVRVRARAPVASRRLDEVLRIGTYVRPWGYAYIDYRLTPVREDEVVMLGPNKYLIRNREYMWHARFNCFVPYRADGVYTGPIPPHRQPAYMGA